MKSKLIACFLTAAFCLTAFSAAMIPASAAPMTGDIWSVYTLTLNDKGVPAYGIAPNYRYTEDGLLIEPVTGTEYTVQTDHAYSLMEGFFLEVRVEDTQGFAAYNSLVFHLWDQSGMIVGYDRSGSGYYGMISCLTDTHYLMSMTVQEAEGNQEGSSSLCGAIKIPAKMSADGQYIYTISSTNGVIKVNGKTVSKYTEVASFLKKLNGGEVYLGISMLATEEGKLAPVTVTRFGSSEATAVIPGTTTVPETQAPETQPNQPNQPDEPEDTLPPDPPADQETQPGNPENPQDPPAQDTDSPHDPPASGDPTSPSDPEDPADPTQPADPGDPENPGGSDGPEDPDGDAPSGGDAEDETQPGETMKDGVTKDTLDFLSKINLFGMFDGCSSTLSLGSAALTTTLLVAAAWVLRRKD